MYSLVTTIHHFLTVDWMGNWPLCPINEAPTLSKGGTFSMDGFWKKFLDPARQGPKNQLDGGNDHKGSSSIY